MTTTTTTTTTTSEDESLSASALAEKYGTTKLYLSSGNGPVYRTVIKSPLRDAKPSEIPIIDVSGIFSSELSDRQHVARQIRDAATNIGFFYIRNHGVDQTAVTNAYEAALAFFRQPMEAKLRANSSQSAFYNGYKPPATQRLNPTESVDVRESFSFQYDPRYDPAVGGNLDAIPGEVREQLRMEDFQWEQTSHLPGFKAALIKYWTQALRLARALVRTFALSLDLDEHFFDDKFSHPDANLLLNYYPPIARPASSSDRKDVNDEEKVSIGSHCDFQVRNHTIDYFSCFPMALFADSPTCSSCSPASTKTRSAGCRS